MMFKEVERGTDAKKTYDFPRFFNLYNDPKEEHPLTKATAGHFWVRWPMSETLTEHLTSLQTEPPIKSVDIDVVRSQFVDFDDRSIADRFENIGKRCHRGLCPG
jgi:hypothetical protein